jgi:pantetheine-phosphate adenylyltransferase
MADLQFELQLALANRTVADVETVFIMASDEYGFASSTFIKQIAACGRLDRLGRLLPPMVIDKLREKLERGELTLSDTHDAGKHG